MEILVEAFGAMMEGIVDFVGERHGCLAGVLTFVLLMILVALSLYLLL